jgi:EmrB/QacA subfamily drug resistance transporter
VSEGGEATEGRQAGAAAPAVPPVATIATGSPPEAGATLAAGLDPRRWWSLAGLCLAAAIVWFAAANLPVATTAIADQIGGSVSMLQWANTAFTLTCGALVIAAGRFGDLFGRRKMLAIGLVVFAAASVPAALAQTPAMLIAGRALMGVGAAAILPATLAIIPIQFAGKEKVTAFSIWMAVAGAGQALAPALAGALTQVFLWPALFWVNLPLCAGALLLVLRTTPESRDEEASRSIDYPGLVTVAGGLVALMYALNEGPDLGWRSPQVLIALGLAVVLLAACLVIERRVRNPLIELHLFRRGSFDAALADNFVYNLTLAGTMYVLALYLVEVRGYDPFTAGMLLLPSTVGMLLLIPLGARMELRRGPRFPLAAGTLIMGIGTFTVGLLSSSTPYWWLAAGIFIQGVGIGLFSTPLSDTAVGLAPPAEAGAASGAFKMSSMVGGAFGVAVLAALYRGFQNAALHAEVAAAHLTPLQQTKADDAFRNTKLAREIFASLPADLKARVLKAVTDAMAIGIGDALKVAAGFAVLALVAVLLLVPKGILHPDRQG